MTLVEDYKQQTNGLSIGTAVQVKGVYDALRTGLLTVEEAEQLIAQLVDAANAAAFSLADAYIALQIERLTGLPAPAAGIPPSDGVERLRKAVHTIFDNLEAMVEHAESVMATEDPVQTATMRLERLARSEPLEAGQNAVVKVMVEQPLVEGWTRAMDDDPCQLCEWWWRGGRIWPKAHPFQSHKGCNCQPEIVLAQSIQSTGYTRRLERNLAPSGTRFTR